MKRFSGVLQFTIGFFLGLIIFVGGLSLIGYFIFSRLAAPPQRPVFPEETKKPTPKATPKVQRSDNTKKEETIEQTKTETTPTPAVTTSPSPEATPEPSPSPSPDAAKEELPKGAYKATVNRSEGLSIRANPSKEAERIGGVDYNANLTVLESQGEWVKVRTAGGQEGWVRSGNLKKEE